MMAFILVTNLTGYAQADLKPVQREMELFNYSKAAELLQKELARNNEKSKCQSTLLLADCYRMMNDVPNAKIWYEKSIQMDGHCQYIKNPGPVIYFYYAQALRSSGEYHQAKLFFLKYDSLVPGQHRGALLAGFCDSAIVIKAAKPEFEIKNARMLNTPQSEFGTAFYQHGIIFASDRISSGNTGKTYGWTGNEYLNLYYSEPVKPDSLFGNFSNPVPSPALTDQLWHEGPVTFNSDFTVAFINQTLLSHDKGKKEPGRVRTHLLKIFSSTLKDGKWSLPVPFFLNSDEYSVGHPALSRDGKTLYFVSDMPGGYGETDIWFCAQEGDKWGKPVNMGAGINSAGKEMFPFISMNGDLYFASDGLPGLGGLDLFVTIKTENQWVTPRNLGEPVNSSCDDLSLIISENGQSGLFSSNRPGGLGGDDIYSFRKVSVQDRNPADSTIRPQIAWEPGDKQSPPASSIDTLKMNKSYRLENILYDFDKWDIRADARPPLDNLVSILKEYPISIELSSHTDCRGSENYNLVLSQKRAESAVQYIISRGISPSRIIAKGYGKLQLLNRCNCTAGVNCSEKEHQYNRRTEFRITSVSEK
jgi:outer membrane protein OmpA-like peptidoglycan-associated protein